MADQVERLGLILNLAEQGMDIVHSYANDPVNAGAIQTGSGPIKNLKQVSADIKSEGEAAIEVAVTELIDTLKTDTSVSALIVGLTDTAILAEESAARAELAADVSGSAVNQFLTVAEGLKATSGIGSTNRFFTVPTAGSVSALRYRNDAGVATLVNEAPSAQAIRDIGMASQNTVVSGLSIAVVDEDGRRTWLEATDAGRPSERAYQLIGEGLTAKNAPALAAAAEEAAVTVAAAAVADVGIESQDTELSGLSIAVVDEDGRRTWLEATPAGRPSARACQLIGEGLTAENAPALVAAAAEAAAAEVAADVGFGEYNSATNETSFVVTDEDGRRTDLEVGLDGKFTQRVINSIASRIGVGAPAPVIPPFPLNAWACWGDSLTAGGWPATLAALSGMSAYNGGWGGQGYAQVAARQGGVPAQLTVAGDTIPASGPVLVTASLNNPLSDGGGRAGTIAGVAGTLAMAAGALTFTRTAPGGAVACPPKSYFTPTDGANNLDKHVVIWIGRNSFKTTPPELIVASIRAMIDYLTPRVKRVIVMSIPPWVGEENGTGGRNTLNACNAAIQAAFPEFWLDISAWLRTTEAATIAGVTFTADDLADITNGLTPRSLRSDSGHLNTVGNVAIGTRVYNESKNRGWM